MKAGFIYPFKKSSSSNTVWGQQKKDQLHYYKKISLLCRSHKIKHSSVHFRDVHFIRHRVRDVGLNNGKELACNAGDLSSIPEWGKSLEKDTVLGTAFQYSCLENPMDRGA